MHIPVLLKEVINFLDPRPGKNFIDLTCGSGGHLAVLLEKIGPEGRVLAVDWDKDAISRTEAALPDKLDSRVIFKNANFIKIAELVAEEKFEPIDGILLDLGWSSDQLEKSGRGFSFLKDEPLDMRYSENNDLTARDIVNYWPPEEIEKILKNFGEERLAGKIVAAIVKARQKKPILTTQELVVAISPAFPKKTNYARIHFATRTFQALRIAVNNEMDNLVKVLPQALDLLVTGGRLVIISFHSLEDRIVKNFFRQQAKEGKIKILTKKPIRPAEEEILKNFRSRSAKLRAVEKIS